MLCTVLAFPQQCRYMYIYIYFRTLFAVCILCTVLAFPHYFYTILRYAQCVELSETIWQMQLDVYRVAKLQIALHKRATHHRALLREKPCKDEAFSSLCNHRRRASYSRCLSVYMYKYVYIYTYIHLYMYTCRYVDIYTYIYIYICSNHIRTSQRCQTLRTSADMDLYISE